MDPKEVVCIEVVTLTWKGETQNGKEAGLLADCQIIAHSPVSHSDAWAKKKYYFGCECITNIFELLGAAIPNMWYVISADERLCWSRLRINFMHYYLIDQV